MKMFQKEICIHPCMYIYSLNFELLQTFLESRFYSPALHFPSVSVFSYLVFVLSKLYCLSYIPFLGDGKFYIIPAYTTVPSQSLVSFPSTRSVGFFYAVSWQSISCRFSKYHISQANSLMMVLQFPSWTWVQLAQEQLQIFIFQSSLSKPKAECSKIKTFTQEKLSSMLTECNGQIYSVCLMWL